MKKNMLFFQVQIYESRILFIILYVRVGMFTEIFCIGKKFLLRNFVSQNC